MGHQNAPPESSSRPDFLTSPTLFQKSCPLLTLSHQRLTRFFPHGSCFTFFPGCLLFLSGPRPFSLVPLSTADGPALTLRQEQLFGPHYLTTSKGFASLLRPISKSTGVKIWHGRNEFEFFPSSPDARVFSFFFRFSTTLTLSSLSRFGKFSRADPVYRNQFCLATFSDYLPSPPCYFLSVSPSPLQGATPSP